jgi:hypothetical protein
MLPLRIDTPTFAKSAEQRAGEFHLRSHSPPGIQRLEMIEVDEQQSDWISMLPCHRNHVSEVGSRLAWS